MAAVSPAGPEPIMITFSIFSSGARPYPKHTITQSTLRVMTRAPAASAFPGPRLRLPSGLAAQTLLLKTLFEGCRKALGGQIATLVSPAWSEIRYAAIAPSG